jgi:hypothetical protein
MFAAKDWHTQYVKSKAHPFVKVWTAMHGWGTLSYPWAEVPRPALFQIQAELDVYANCTPLPAQSDNQKISYANIHVQQVPPTVQDIYYSISLHINEFLRRINGIPHSKRSVAQS